MTQQTSAPCWRVLEYDTEAQILILECCSFSLTSAVKLGKQNRKDKSLLQGINSVLQKKSISQSWIIWNNGVEW